MSFADAVTTVLQKKYADFSGRARRSEYWWYYLFTVLLTLAINIVFGIIGSDFLTYAVSGIVGLALLIPGLAVGARRLHDTGRSGWWLLLILIFWLCLIPLIVLIVFFVMDSTPGDNKYGPNPKGIAPLAG